MLIRIEIDTDKPEEVYQLMGVVEALLAQLKEEEKHNDEQ